MIIDDRDRRGYTVQAALAVTPSHQGEPGFETVTQGRQSGNYSSCGDLPAYVLWCLGCRDSRLVNRDPWEAGKNITKLFSGGQRLGCWQSFKLGAMPQPGDICLIGKYPYEMEHVFVVTGVDGTSIESADYGQFAAGKHCGALRTRTLKGDRLYAPDGHSRAFVGWVNIDLVPLEAEPS